MQSEALPEPQALIALQPDPVEVLPVPDSGLLAAGIGPRVAKRGLDIAVSAILLLILLPVMTVIALAIALTSRGNVFFVQDRVGRDGAHFPMIKFRTMHRGAHELRDHLMHLNEASGPVFKIRDDPRLSRVGRLLRRFSLDELPQLINVLLGHMSLVGPRPPLPEEVAVYGGYERQRLAVTPGITCIWQVSGRADIDFATWLEMDLRYIREWTFGLDMRLLVKTIPAVLSRRGAY